MTSNKIGASIGVHPDFQYFEPETQIARDAELDALAARVKAADELADLVQEFLENEKLDNLACQEVALAAYRATALQEDQTE
jgi:hypothetical protein